MGRGPCEVAAARPSRSQGPGGAGRLAGRQERGAPVSARRSPRAGAPLVSGWAAARSGATGPKRSHSPLPRPQPRRDPRAARRTRLPTVWLASCFMRLNCFFMAAVAAAAGGARAGQDGRRPGGYYIASLPKLRRRRRRRQRRRRLKLPGRRPRPRSVTSSGTARPPSRSGRAEPSRAGPSRAEPSRAEPSRAEPSRAEPSRAYANTAQPDPGKE
ncbi:hypothetical protein P7K49_023179 [Saguinus oedipus]|uniref:Uncharacterized protein n=1 Tax=Saguinus oedipus TaxID=9490 RepID=A0ABQ9UKX4_SAGOE|nr:hypothetical protein P7K49_023179 [Saguinus oedipus]